MKLRTEYMMLKDRSRKVRVIVCLLSCHEKVTFGIAIRSKQDENDYKIGKRISFARARRAMLGRPPCVATRVEVAENLWSLNFKDFRKIGQLTEGKVTNFAKGGVWCDSYEDLERVFS